jgi:hypothetical protein
VENYPQIRSPLQMNHPTPKISFRKKRFDSKGNLLQTIPTQKKVKPQKKVQEVCSLLEFPFEKVFKLIRNYQEAKTLFDCLVVSNELKLLWPTLLMSFVSFHIHKKFVNNESSKMKLFLLQTENVYKYSIIRKWIID